MSYTIHSPARTTPRTRWEIKETTVSQSRLTERYGVTKALRCTLKTAGVDKWRRQHSQA